MNQRQITCALIFLSFFINTYCQENKRNHIGVEALTAYNKWRNTNKRVYHNENEISFRQTIFFENLQKVKEHNSNAQHTYTIGLNQFSDMTDEEFNQKYLTTLIASDRLQAEDTPQTNLNTDINDIPDSPVSTYPIVGIDWRLNGAITPVKNQGSCGSCWAFSAVALMESYDYIKNGKISNFSEQQLIDCAIRANGYYSFGCRGGSASQALQYASVYGILNESQYPYVAVKGRCKVASPTTGFYPKTFQYVNGTVKDLMDALKISPVSVAVDASFWNYYRSGVFNGCSSKPNLNHAVLAVGYDFNGNWIVKNSWGSNWGEQGFIKIAAGSTCGIVNYSYQLS